MPAYLVVESEITDAAKFEPYRALAPVAVTKFGGRYLARGGSPEAVENGWLISSTVTTVTGEKVWFACQPGGTAFHRVIP